LHWVSVLAALSCSCAATAPRSHALNPLGWPSKGLLALGRAAADSELLLLRETGRLLHSVGELVDAPALLVEGVTTLSGDKIAGSGKLLVVGTGGTVTAAVNLPFFMTGGRTLDIGKEADRVNDALAFIERAPPTVWRHGPEDDRTAIFPRGTRVRASGKNLVWCFPDGAEILQSAEQSHVFRLTLEVTGERYVAQERSWGMVVPYPEQWQQLDARARVITVIHEFYHQLLQLRESFLGWSTAYWPAYGYSYAVDGYGEHWAEADAGASTIDRALSDWY
jgi:hypothetical protein